MRWLQGTYAARYNRRHNLVGHVWQGRYKSPVIKGEDTAYFTMVSRYIHLNPVRAGLISSDDPRLATYRWSSFPILCRAPSKRPVWLYADRTYRAFDLLGDDIASRRKFRQRMELECREWLRGEQDEEDQEELRRLQRGWYIGDKAFRDRMLDQLEGAVSGRKKHSLEGEALRVYQKKRALGIIDAVCKHLGVSVDEMRGRQYSEVDKQLLVALIRKKTGMSYDWIIEALNMGSHSSVYNAIRASRDLSSRAKKSRWKQLCQLTNSYH